MNWHVIIIIILPSGIGYKNSNDVEFHLEKDAIELVVSVTWPAWVVNMDFFKLFESQERTTKDFVLYEMALKRRMAQMRTTVNDLLRSVARIPLPFQVQPHIADDDWRYLGERTGCRVLYMDLKAPSNNSYEGKKVKACTTADLEKKHVWKTLKTNGFTLVR